MDLFKLKLLTKLNKLALVLDIKKEIHKYKKIINKIAKNKKLNWLKKKSK